MSRVNLNEIPVAQLKKLSIEEVADLGRFNLRVLANMVGLQQDSKELTKYMGLSNIEQAAFVQPRLQTLTPSVEELLAAEMNDAVVVARYRRVCGDFSKLLRTTRRT